VTALRNALDELVDYVDAHDRFVRTGPRGGAGPLHCRTSVTVLVTPSREVLVYRRPAAAKVYPGHHDVLVGGMVRAGETYRAAARRELAEELGVDPVQREVLKLSRESPIGPCHLTVYLAELPPQLQPNPAEIDGYEVRPVDEVLSNPSQPFIPDGLDVLRRLFG
jgi:8-oxo-dGTP pyrophosphatase MutT (NUDIX family)